MTIEKIIGWTADDFEKADDKLLLEYFDKYLHITRPDRAAVANAAEAVAKRQKAKSGKVDPALEAMAKLKQFGINFDAL